MVCGSVICVIRVAMVYFAHMADSIINVMRGVDIKIRSFSIHVIVDVNVVKSE